MSISVPLKVAIESFVHPIHRKHMLGVAVHQGNLSIPWIAVPYI